MKTEHPTDTLIPQLRALWKEAFGDTDAFLDLFFSLGYDPRMCCCIRSQDRVTAALYWMDVALEDQKFAYLYAVATARDCRGQGLCRQLMADTAAVLGERGYQGAILVPQEPGLRAMYSKMGYRDCAPIDEFFCAAGDSPLSLRELSGTAYAARRVSHLPEGSIQPEVKTVGLLEALARFYEGPGFLAAVSREREHLRILEYLGDRDALPGLIAALRATEATVRAPGTAKPFAMYLPLTPDCQKPAYYPFALD